MSINAFFRKSLPAFLSKIEVRWAIKTGLSAGLAYAWYNVIERTSGPEKIISGLWCVVSAIIASQAHLGASFKVGWLRFIGTAIGALMGALFTKFFGVTPLTIGISVALAVSLLSFFGLRASISLTGATIALVMILWKLNPDHSPWLFAFSRFIDATIGISIAVLVSFTVWPQRATQKVKVNLADILSSIYQLFRVILLTDKSEKSSADQEKLINTISDNLKKDLLFLEDAKLETIVNKSKIEKWFLLHRKFTEVGELVYSLRLLNKKALEDIRNESLKVAILDVKENLSLAFQEILLCLQTGTEVKKVFDLDQTIQHMEKEMARLKNKEVPFEFSKNFFVFFYLVKEIVSTLKEIIPLIDNFQNGREDK